MKTHFVMLLLFACVQIFKQFQLICGLLLYYDSIKQFARLYFQTNYLKQLGQIK